MFTRETTLKLYSADITEITAKKAYAHFSIQNLCNAFRNEKWALEEGHSVTHLTVTQLQCKQESISITGQPFISLQLFYDHCFQVAQEVEITSVFQK